MFRSLTGREEQILTLIAGGLTNRQIARELCISESTVENHIHHIYAKLRLSNRAQAVGYAYQQGMRALPHGHPEDRGNPS